MSNIRQFKRSKAKHDDAVRAEQASQILDSMFDIDIEMPFDKDSSLWMCWLYPSEWRFLFIAGGALQEADMIERGQTSLQAIFIDAIAYLQREYGYAFEGLHLDDEDALFAKQKEPLATVNVYWIRMLQFMGKNPDLQLAPDVLRHARFALEFAREKVPEAIEVFEEFLRWCEESVAEVIRTKDDIPDEAKKHIVELEKLRRQFYRENPKYKREDFDL